MLNRKIKKLFHCFPGGIINSSEEFIIQTQEHYHSFSLRSCKTEEDVQAKVLEWCSINIQLINQINKYLKTDFSEQDLKLIYEYLGNAINHDLTVKFIRSNFDVRVLN
ncbi:hypothetical protein NYR30_04115 [Gallibacterium salpingitidis]|uniref:hypothetical protein n=1 Tax=Gallibacterium salpingitidis TaxID=505341 RepID=UPI002670A20C|nr:hypothetical protein [Gallibacterium salpingitidis]WKT00481.1 hypothetical protein NYR30_04115 [Gallibacterium salpingitidis]